MNGKKIKVSLLASLLITGCILGSQPVLVRENTSTEVQPTSELVEPVAEETSAESAENQLVSDEMKAVSEFAGEEAKTDSSSLGTENQQGADVLNMTDSDASQETKELFDYLREKAASPNILFGQQHALDEGVTLTSEGSRAGSTESEVKNAVGDYPAVFGWDTLSLDGHEKPGVAGDPEQSLKNVTESMKTAHQLGGVLVLSMHPYNFVTGGNFNDTSGNVVDEILPGGSKNQEFNQWLDRIADLAQGLKDENGKDIPLLFRPFHEQTGSWFWWGESTTKPDQYKALYRYTVEYLRDQRDVHNLLYVYSPNTTAPADQERYLQTYPGDDYVDILGIDSYDSKDNAGSEQFLTGLVKDLSMIVNLAEQKGKVAALTEFGYSAQGLKKTGNTLDWYSRVFKAIQADAKASKIAYMLTWANFGLPNNIYVPYRDINGSLGGDHELLPDFEAFYKDANTIFAKEVGQIYQKGKTYQTQPKQTESYLIRPVNGDVISQQEIQILVKAGNQDDRVVFQIGNQAYDLTKEGDYFKASITLPKELDNQVLSASLTYTNKEGVSRQENLKLYTRFGEVVESPFVVDQFETYFGDSDLLQQAYSSNGDTIQMSLSDSQKNSGQYGMVYDYEVADKGYAGRQLSFEKNWQGANALTFWLKHSGYPQHLTVQVRIGNVSYEKNISLSQPFEGAVTLPLVEFLPATWEGNQTARIDQVGLRQVSQFALYLGGEKGKGTLYIDDIQVMNDPELPEIVEKYEPKVTDKKPLIYDFDTIEDGWNAPGLASEAGSLKATVSAQEGVKTEVNLQKPHDLSAYNWYQVKLKSSQVIQAKLYLKVGDNWQWVNNESATVQDDWTTLIFDIAGIGERGNTREIGLEFLGQGGAESADIMIDRIAFAKDLSELEPTMPAETTTTTLEPTTVVPATSVTSDQTTTVSATQTTSEPTTSVSVAPTTSEPTTTVSVAPTTSEPTTSAVTTTRLDSSETSHQTPPPASKNGKALPKTGEAGGLITSLIGSAIMTVTGLASIQYRKSKKSKFHK